MKKPASRAARFLELCKQAAERLGGNTQPSDANAQHLAALILSQEEYVARLIDGVDVNPDVLLRLDEAIRAAAPIRNPVVTIRIVNPSMTCCPSCDVEFKPPEYSNEPCVCPSCGCEFDPESPISTREKKRAAAKAALPPPDTNGSSPPTSENNPPPASEVQASALAPVRPAPPPPPPPAPPISETMAAWNRHCGYNRSARDGGLIKGPAVPHVDPNLTAAAPRENYNNAGPLCWVAGTSNRQWRDPVTPDPNPNFNPDGSARGGHPLPYPTHPKK